MLKILYKLKELFNKMGELFYIGSTDKLPPPLSKDEEEYYVTMASDGDLFARDRPLPDIEEGDILGILNAGAYGYTMASNYNSRPLPAEILVKNGESFVIREAQSFDDIFEKQSVPDHLQ